MTSPDYTLKLILTISGDSLSPDDMSSELDIKPTSVSYKGVVRTGASRPSKTNIWSWYAFHSNTQLDDLDHQADTLIQTFSKNVNELAKASETMKVTVCVIVDAIKYYPGLIFNPELISFCAEIGAFLEIESYVQVQSTIVPA